MQADQEEEKKNWEMEMKDRKWKGIKVKERYLQSFVC